ncbi:MAG: M23 family metallopeptidase [Actinomycetota bacterium]|nr:M23 family metallopeptidase [Actinomycetota bacterium]
MPIISGTPPARPQPSPQKDPRQAAIEAAKRAGIFPGRPDWWQALTPQEQKQVVTLFNQLYPDPTRRPGGYRTENVSDAFFNNPVILHKDRRDALLAAAVPFKSTFDQPTSTPRVDENLRYFAERAGGTVPGRVQVEASQADVNRAISVNGRSAPYMKMIVGTAAKHGVPWQVLWGLLRTESGFDAKARGVNKNGTVDSGIAQINSIHNIPEVQANNPAFAIDWAARKLKEGFSAYGDWGLAALNYHRPRSARTLFEGGKSETGWGVHDRDYVGKVFAGLDAVGFTGDDAKLQFIGDEGQGAGAVPGPVLPDPVAVKERAANYLRSLFFREPTDAELQGAVDLVTGLAVQSHSDALQARGAAEGASNPFRTPDDELQHPLPGARRTSGFGPRVHPVHGQQKMHSGTDFAASEGTPIRSAVSGRVTFAGKKGGYGNIVIVQGNDGREYRYAHISRIGATTGDEVIAGAAIGGVGQTGTATGPHLHFEIRQGGKALDPETVFAADENSPAPAPAGAGAVQAGPVVGPATTDLDPDARLRQQIQNSPEYKELYGNKPEGVADDVYAASFANVGQELLGNVTPANEAIRAGLRTGQAATTAGVIAGDPRSLENKTFRQRMLEAAEAINRMV